MTRKVEETDIVMQEVETVSQQYLPLSTACSSIYFTMESLKQVGRPRRAGGSPRHPRAGAHGPLRRLQIHFLYQYSLQFFLDIYHNVLYENPNLKGVTDHTQRLSTITKDLFQVQRGLGAWPGGALGAGRGGAFSRAGAVVTARCLPCLQVAFNRVARGMLHQDHITFAMLLARIKLKGTVG